MQHELRCDPKEEETDDSQTGFSSGNGSCHKPKWQQYTVRPLTPGGTVVLFVSVLSAEFALLTG